MSVDERRNRQSEIVKDYLGRKGEARLTRHELFREDGIAGLWTTDTGEPVTTQGRQGLKRHGEWSLSVFPDWEWYNVRVFSTDDADFFWAECDGRGRIAFPGYPVGYYENHFLHSFEFEEELIVRQREFMNPVKQFEALGLKVPEIRREGFPK